MIRVGVIGYGYWGPNIVRNFQRVDGARVEVICDKSQDMLKRASQNHPEVRLTSDCSEILSSSQHRCCGDRNSCLDPL